MNWPELIRWAASRKAIDAGLLNEAIEAGYATRFGLTRKGLAEAVRYVCEDTSVTTDDSFEAASRRLALALVERVVSKEKP